MSLTRVGSSQGPDLAKLNQFCKNYPDKQFIAAGGIRNIDDLLTLKRLGVNQALIASALHSCTISRDNIQNL
jgi:phosphoribosylformimino-5-aminoimidazole carboxamide ribotide isomerase